MLLGCSLPRNLELSAEPLKSLDGASQIDLDFPQSIYEREMVCAIRYGGARDRLLHSCDSLRRDIDAWRMESA